MKFLLFLLVALALCLPSCSVRAQEVKKVSNSSSQEFTTPKSINHLQGNFNNEIEIIFSDIDGTILKLDSQNPKTEIPTSVKTAVHKLHKAEIPLVLTTGRSYVEASEIAKEAGNADSFLITQQGAEIWDKNGQIIYRDSISNKDVNSILKRIEQFKKKNKFDSKIVVFADGKAYATEDFKLPYNWEKLIVLKSFDELGPEAKIVKICISEPNPKILRLIQADLKKKFPIYHIDISAVCYCDVSSESATKGNAITKLSQMLGLDLKNSATLGDAENDISMLTKVKKSGGLSIAIENAMPSVKNSAEFVTSSVYEDGFANAVNKILINNAFLKITK